MVDLLGSGPSVPAALAYMQARFKGRLRTKTSYKVTAITYEKALDASYERVSLTIVNLGAVPIAVFPGEDLSLGGGVHLGAFGGLFNVNVEQDGILPCEQWNVALTGGGATVFIVEVIRDIAVDVEG